MGLRVCLQLHVPAAQWWHKEHTLVTCFADESPVGSVVGCSNV